MKPYIEPRSEAFTYIYRDTRHLSKSGKKINTRRRIKKALKSRARQFAKLDIKLELYLLNNQ